MDGWMDARAEHSIIDPEGREMESQATLCSFNSNGNTSSDSCHIVQIIVNPYIALA